MCYGEYMRRQKLMDQLQTIAEEDLKAQYTFKPELVAIRKNQEMA